MKFDWLFKGNKCVRALYTTCGGDDVLSDVFLQAGVCGAAAAEHVFRRED